MDNIKTEWSGHDDAGTKDQSEFNSQHSALSTQHSALGTRHSALRTPHFLVVAIDGPSGSGKSTVGKAIARALKYLYIDSGAVYRAVGLKALETNTSLTDSHAVAALAKQASIKLEGDPDHLRVRLDARDVTSDIRLPDASHASSVVATIPEVREAVVEKLRVMSLERGVVMDGRDIGTKVFPNAPVKIFLDASLDVRARRRCEEERERGRDVTVEQVRLELQERDRRDTERTATPLVKAPDAVFIDTSAMPLDRVIDQVLEIIRTRS
jgi:cytidylate kinase